MLSPLAYSLTNDLAPTASNAAGQRRVGVFALVAGRFLLGRYWDSGLLQAIRPSPFVTPERIVP